MDFYSDDSDGINPEFLKGTNMSVKKEKEIFKFNQSVLCINDMETDECIGRFFLDVKQLTASAVISYLNEVSSSASPDAIIYASDYNDRMFYENLVKISYELKERGFNTPFIIVRNDADKEFKKKILQFGADDCIDTNFNPEKLNYWIDFLRLFKKLSKENSSDKSQFDKLSISRSKRLFDIIVSSVILLFASPIMMLVAVIIKLESGGSIFYVSKRAGMGYKVFNFLKFRSMSTGADKELSKLLHLNQYGGGGVEVKDDNGSNPVFFKIKNDPRITRFGKFLRDTSIDELPQLINVLRGDMSIVGNRPLPLYEAQQLTKDQAALRFMAPAGITGLWQVTKRGKAEMSEDERIALDIQYAKEYSFIYDLKLLFKTIPALLQEEKV
jgi:lipopolysaccharide/colanic/teichoic acid biosynthesis glycosyltransferase